MANTNPSAQEVNDALKDYKVDFKKHNNWDTVGSPWNATGGGLYGCIMHHTGAGVQGYSGAPSLTWMLTAFDKPACNILVGRGKGDTTLLSARAVYHSGLGGPWPAIGLNSAGYGAEARTFGVEIEGSTAYGNIPESKPYFTEYQEENAARIAAALWDLCGWPNDGSRIVTHGDWTDSGKYLGTNNYGPHRGRKSDTRRTTHSGKYWRKQAEKYRSTGGGGGGNGNGNGNGGGSGEGNPNNDGKGSNNKTEDNVVDFARVVKPNAVAKSTVTGTPQTARFALMNMANESIFISEGSTNVLTGSGKSILWLTARTITEGETYEVSKKLDDPSANGELIIDSAWVQNESAAYAVTSLIARSYKSKYKSIIVEIFGNPFVQIGDLAKVKYDIGQVDFDADDYFVVTRISHSIDTGLKTTVELSPVTKVFRMV